MAPKRTGGSLSRRSVASACRTSPARAPRPASAVVGEPICVTTSRISTRPVRVAALNRVVRRQIERRERRDAAKGGVPVGRSPWPARARRRRGRGWPRARGRARPGFRTTPARPRRGGGPQPAQSFPVPSAHDRRVRGARRRPCSDTSCCPRMNRAADADVVGFSDERDLARQFGWQWVSLGRRISAGVAVAASSKLPRLRRLRPSVPRRGGRWPRRFAPIRRSG